MQPPREVNRRSRQRFLADSGSSLRHAVRRSVGDEPGVTRDEPGGAGDGFLFGGRCAHRPRLHRLLAGAHLAGVLGGTPRPQAGPAAGSRSTARETRPSLPSLSRSSAAARSSEPPGSRPRCCSATYSRSAHRSSPETLRSCLTASSSTAARKEPRPRPRDSPDGTAAGSRWSPRTAPPAQAVETRYGDLAATTVRRCETRNEKPAVSSGFLEPSRARCTWSRSESDALQIRPNEEISVGRYETANTNTPRSRYCPRSCQLTCNRQLFPR